MRSLKTRVVKMEEKRQQRQGQKPYEVGIDDGRVTARITPLSGRPPWVMVRVNDLYLDSTEALQLIRPLLPDVCGTVFCFPRRAKSREEWSEWILKSGIKERHEETQNPTLH